MTIRLTMHIVLMAIVWWCRNKEHLHALVFLCIVYMLPHHCTIKYACKSVVSERGRTIYIYIYTYVCVCVCRVYVLCTSETMMQLIFCWFCAILYKWMYRHLFAYTVFRFVVLFHCVFVFSTAALFCFFFLQEIFKSEIPVSCSLSNLIRLPL